MGLNWRSQEMRKTARTNDELIKMRKMGNYLTIADVINVHWTFTIAIVNIADMLKEKGSWTC